jgi:death-on-curing family protein
MQVAFYEPHQSARYLAATLSYGIIKGHPFLDGNKRTAFLLGNIFLRIQGLPGLVDCTVEHADIIAIAERYIAVAAGQLDVEGLANE